MTFSLSKGCASDTESNRSAMLHDLFKGYDSDEHPLPEGYGPVIVKFGAKLVRLIELVCKNVIKSVANSMHVQ